MVKIATSSRGMKRISAVLPGTTLAMEGARKEERMTQLWWVLIPVAVLAAIFLLPMLLGMRIIPNNKVGIVEKLWSARGSLPEGRLIALSGEAGFQAELLRGGVHFGYRPWQYRVHKVRLTSVPQGKIGYVFARDGKALPPEQTLGRVVDCNHFQNARAFLAPAKSGGGQRGRQRAILREGVYAINVALFVVISEDAVYSLELGDRQETETFKKWQKELVDMRGFSPEVIDRSHSRNREDASESDDSIAIESSDSEASSRFRLWLRSITSGLNPLMSTSSFCHFLKVSVSCRSPSSRLYTASSEITTKSATLIA